MRKRTSERWVRTALRGLNVPRQVGLYEVGREFLSRVPMGGSARSYLAMLGIHLDTPVPRTITHGDQIDSQNAMEQSGMGLAGFGVKNGRQEEDEEEASLHYRPTVCSEMAMPRYLAEGLC